MILLLHLADNLEELVVVEMLWDVMDKQILVVAVVPAVVVMKVVMVVAVQ
jgi:hypothetical protein